MREAIAAALALTTLVALGWGDAARADEPTGTVRVDELLRFQIADGGLLEVDGERHYLDTLEVRARGGGGVLINELSMDDYVAGIAEMPADWPMEALKAQAVAARTYGWYVSRTATYDGYDICPTVSCQVFRGANVVRDAAAGERWQEAVERTSGEVLLDDTGDPVLARYFSTSGGRTYANEEVFPSSGAHDHLVSIDDPYDAVSPWHRWTVRFTREEFDAIAARGQQLAQVVPIVEAERLGEVDDPRARLRFVGEDGTDVEVGTGNLRDFLSSVAPDLFPERFPPLREDGLRPLPSTVPTARYDIEVTDDEVILHGQGWGHGVGMGQYGARGRAEDGADYDEILAAYYNGLRPARTDALPERMRVGIEVGDTLTIGGDDVVAISAGDREITASGLGSWQLQRAGDGWELTPPEGHGRSLDVAATRIADELGDLTDAVAVQVEVNKPVRLTLEVADGDGRPVLTRDLGVVEAGRHSAVWRLDDQDGSLVSDGQYQVALRGEDHAGDRAGTPVDVELPLEDPEPGDATARPEAVTDTNLWGPAALVALLLAIGLGGGLLLIRRTR